MSLNDLLTVVNSDPKTTLDDMIYKSIVYTTINDLRTYGDTSCFYESMTVDDRAKLYALESFVNSVTVRDAIIQQALLDNRQLDMGKSLSKSNLCTYISDTERFAYINENGMLGRLLNLCAKIEEIDILFPSDSYQVSNVLEDNDMFNIIFSYFTPNNTSSLFSAVFESMLRLNLESFISKLIDLNLITVVQSSLVQTYREVVSCSYNGSGYVLATNINLSRGVPFEIVYSLTLDGITSSAGYVYLGSEFESNATAGVNVTNYNGNYGKPTYGSIMYILPKNN